MPFRQAQPRNYETMNNKLTEQEKKMLEIFGSRIQVNRQQKNMSIALLAEKCGLSQQHMEMIEKGTWEDVDTITMFRLSEALNVDLQTLLKGL